ncbi:hypothetical protein BOX15_Mlig016949g1 [Macrostomum lignano]|uniref:F-actin-capping protein subunit beta n=2 Tax=Macrostomum lignano TaxID=282301 RepID=A0A267G7W9_9PLAT|nr:hypothetical protein BOX15_Mlig016949g1 [Macrostomum lignano]
MDAGDRRLNCALDMMRRLPPQEVEANLAHLIDLVPDLTENLLCSVDQPLKVARDSSCNKDYLLCDYNRDADSYRSPWSNKYDPPLEDGTVPSDRLRSLEIDLNSAMEQYQDLYFGGGISSAYLWDMDNGFAGVVLIKKIGDAARTRGQWDSIHVVEVAHKIGGRSAKYKLTATTMLWVRTADTAAGEFDIGGSLTRQVEKEATVADMQAHIFTIGRMIEETETSMRQQMIQVYFDGLNGIVETMRTSVPKNTREAQRRVQEELSSVIGSKAAAAAASRNA